MILNAAPFAEDIDGVVEPSDATKLTTIFDFSHTRNSDNALVLNPGTLATPASATYRLANPWDTNTDSQPLIENTSGGVSIHLDQDLQFAHLSDIVAYRRSATVLNFDLDFTPLPEEGAILYEDERQFSEELQLSGKLADTIQWAAGIFYFDALGSYVPPSEVTLGTTTAIALQGYEKTRSVAGYTQGTAQILPDTNLTLGFRYTSEKRALVASQGIYVEDIEVAPLPSADTSKTFVRPSYRVALDHRFTDDILGYASFNTGFKSGGFNTQVPTDPPFNPETLKAYEIGFKNDLLGRRLRVNVAAFYYDYTNIQEQHLEAASSGVINGPPAKLYGVDLDLQARITNDFRIGGGFEYLHSRFVGSTPFLPIGTVLGNVPLTTGSVDGNQLPQAPEIVVNLTADYTFKVLGGDADANATFEHNSQEFFEPDNIIRQPAYSKVNLSLKWTSLDSRYSTGLWCNNLTNVATFGAGQSAVNGSQYMQYAPPRTYGITVGYHL